MGARTARTERGPRVRAVLLATLLAATPLASGADAQQPSEQAAVREESAAAAEVRQRFDASAASRILAAAESAARAGAPRELVYRKALEGAAKGVPTPRIVAAVEAFAERVGRGAGLLGERAARSDVSSAAEALGRGVPPEDVRAIARDVDPGSLSVALLVLADLVEIGVPAGDARGLVTEAFRAGMGDRELLELEAEVRGRVRRGESPVGAVSELRESIRRGRAGVPPGR